MRLVWCFFFFHLCRVTELKNHSNHFFLCFNQDSYGMAVIFGPKIQDHHHPYISWQEYLENQQILSQNQTNKPDQLLPNIAREGRALLQGLLLCGGCGLNGSIIKRS